MNKAILASMHEQMCPSETAQAALRVRLEEAARKKEERPMKKYLAVAACAALLLGAYPAYQALAPKPPALHSVTTVDGSDLAVMKAQQGETAVLTGDKGSGDRDQAMLPEELVEAMEDAGFSTADIDAYQALGYEMTWANWWKYVHEQESGEGEEPFDLASLEEFSRRELPVNTGLADELPGGAYVGDLPAQPGADAYQLFMDHFGDTHPDWYGGAYVTDNGTLIVLLVEDKNPGDKTLELEVLEAAGGRTAPVGFASAKYSRNDLERINGELLTLLDGKGIFATWGIYDDQNRIVLDVAEPLPDDLLAAIARLDPDDDAILIRVVEERSVVTDVMKGPDPGGTTKVVEELPQTKGEVQRAEYDLLPIE